MIALSGKFCIAIPMESASAPPAKPVSAPYRAAQLFFHKENARGARRRAYERDRYPICYVQPHTVPPVRELATANHLFKK